MQATQQTKQPQVPLPVKPKGKLVATPPAKPKAASVKQGVTKQMGSNKAALMTQSVKQANLMAQSIKQASLIQAKTAAQAVKTVLQAAKPNAAAQGAKETSQAKQGTPPVPKLSAPARQSTVVKPTPSPKQTVSTLPKSIVTQSQLNLNVAASLCQTSASMSKSMPSLVTTPQKSPLIKQRPLQKSESQVVLPNQTQVQNTTLIHSLPTTTAAQSINKVVQGTRSLLIRPPTVQTTASATSNNTTPQVTPTSRRGVVRVLSPATPSSGKSLISPRALMQSGTPTPKKRTTTPTTSSVTTIAQTAPSATTVVSSVPTAVTSSMSTRTVQLAGGRTVQLAANQTVHLPGGQAVQLTSGHTLQLSSLQLPTHSVRLPSGQTVQLASPQAVQAVKMSTTAVKSPSPRALQTSATVKNIQTSSQPTVQIPVSTVQLAGQTVHIGGQTVQLAGQSVQLTGHTVKLPSGQSVQVASQSVLPSQSVQLPSGQTVQLSSGNVQTVQLSGTNVQLAGQSVQMAGGQSVQLGSQTVQLGGQTVQLAGGQTVQLPSGQTLQLSSGQTVQLSSGQTLQLASGQTVHLANQAGKSISQVIRSQTPVEKSATGQPIVAKLLTNSQQSDGSAIRVTSSGGAPSSQTLVLSNIGAQTITTSSSSAPVLKLQQVNPIQQVKLAQGIKIQQSGAASTVATSSGVRSVLMDGQQLKLVGGRHVLARILRPAHPPQ
ncbi:hypothetical protein O3G_MSEX001563 [Manduca sexta]|uniref:Uncharacterized protein n=1 Tax=Manduca sexta TaxID=7130 RepID=A0A921YKZ7_MANSE|nr:hypothetical protein O3G_MSEX001563 [Manduca sexta]